MQTELLKRIADSLEVIDGELSNENNDERIVQINSTPEGTIGLSNWGYVYTLDTRSQKWDRISGEL